MMVALSMVLVAHLLGDWVAQTDYQAANKTSSWRAMHGHCISYHMVMAVFMLPVWPDWRLVVLLTVSYATHAIIDRRWPVRWLLQHTGSPAFSEQVWGVIAVDQALHLSILLTLVAVMGS